MVDLMIDVFNSRGNATDYKHAHNSRSDMLLLGVRPLTGRIMRIPGTVGLVAHPRVRVVAVAGERGVGAQQSGRRDHLVN
jgi:hypothetical protein